MTDYAKLRDLAKVATSGPWQTGSEPRPGRMFFGTVTDPDDPTEPGVPLGEAHPDDAEFIAAANPQTVLALLDEIEALRRGQGSAPAPAAAGAVPVALHEAHPIPDTTATDTA